MKVLIVNADDFGYTRGVNRAILDAHRTGILTSASLMANSSAFGDAVELARREPGLSVGCHLNFVEGRPVSPVSQVPHLVSADGNFHSALRLGMRLLRGAVPAQEIEREATAQLERLLEAGIVPSHVDTHKHTHLHPAVAEAVARAARRLGVGWIRRPFENLAPPALRGAWLRKTAGRCLNVLAPAFERRMAAQGLRVPDFFSGLALTGRLTRPALEQTLTALPEGVTELMCHPGYCDAALESSPTRLKRQRETELEAVADPRLRAKLTAGHVALSGFREVPEKAAVLPGSAWAPATAPASGE